jgi:hypothetical protein
MWCAFPMCMHVFCWKKGFIIVLSLCAVCMDRAAAASLHVHAAAIRFTTNNASVHALLNCTLQLQLTVL